MDKIGAGKSGPTQPGPGTQPQPPVKNAVVENQAKSKPDGDVMSFERKMSDEELLRANPAPKFPPDVVQKKDSKLAGWVDRITSKPDKIRILRTEEPTAQQRLANAAKGVDGPYTFYLSNGLTLQRFRDTDNPGSLDAQTGSVYYWLDKLNQIGANLSMYDRGSGQPNHFLEHVTVKVYATTLQVPDAGTNFAVAVRVPAGSYNTEIRMNKRTLTDLNHSKFDSNVLAHEIGHAYHNWANVYLLPESNASYKNEFNRFFSSQMANNGVPYTPGTPSYPWGTNLPSEVFGDAFRYYLGPVGA